MTLALAKLEDEAGRIAALQRLDARSLTSETSFNQITGLLQLALELEMATISLITEDKQIFKSRQGVDLKETPRSAAFCNFAIRKYDPLVIEDTHQDPRVRDNPLVTGPPFLRCYIGAPLTTEDGYNLGTICGFGTAPRRFPERDLQIVSKCATLVMNQLELRSTANRDFLTKVGNRRSFADGLEKEMARVGRNGATATVAFLDIDHFKQVNDAFGHPAGDRVLREFADLVTGECRHVDHVFRLGGEEFAVLLPETDLDSARVWADRVLQRVAGALFNGAAAIRVTVSIGLAAVDAGPTTPDTITEMADRALYTAKRLGRNRVVAH
jgi:diguanylate cyclase (GGDEF)-like protein